MLISIIFYILVILHALSRNNLSEAAFLGKSLKPP